MNQNPATDDNEHNDSDQLKNTVTRRDTLRKVGAASISIGALSSTIGAASARYPDIGDDDGSDDEPGAPYFDKTRATFNPGENSAGDCMTADLTTTVKWGDPEYDDHIGTDVVPFEVNADGAIFYNYDCGLDGLTNELSHASITIDYPDDQVYAGTSNHWIGGMSNYDDPEDATAGDYAAEIVEYTMGFVPYVGPYADEILSASSTASALHNLGQPADDRDRKHRSWSFGNVGRINVWSRFKAEVEDDPYDVDISSEIGGFLGVDDSLSFTVSK